MDQSKGSAYTQGIRNQILLSGFQIAVQDNHACGIMHAIHTLAK